MVVLTRKADYALLAMAHLGRAETEDGVTSARAIAVRYSIPTSVLMNILKTLHRKGLVVSIRGARGGYRLARPPGEITLAEVIRSIEGPVRITRCSENPDGSEDSSCERSPWCPVRGPAQLVQEKLNQFFQEVSVSDLVDRAYSPDNRAVI